MTAKKHLRTGQLQGVVYELVRGKPQEGAGPATVRHIVRRQDVPEGKFLSKNLLAHAWRDQVQVDLDCAEFNRLIVAVKQKDNLTKIFSALAPPSQNPQMNGSLMKFFERRRHVVLVREQAFVWLRKCFGVNFGQRRQRLSCTSVKIVQR